MAGSSGSRRPGNAGERAFCGVKPRPNFISAFFAFYSLKIIPNIISFIALHEKHRKKVGEGVPGTDRAYL
jgi:hypothetical protein